MSLPASPQLSISDGETTSRDHDDRDSVYSWEDFLEQDRLNDQEETIPPSINEEFEVGEFDEVFENLRSYLTRTSSPGIPEGASDDEEIQEQQQGPNSDDEEGLEEQDNDNDQVVSHLYI